MYFKTKLFITAALCIFTTFATAGVTYEEGTRYLSIPTVQIGDTQYNFLVVKIDAATIVSYGSSSKASGAGVAARQCTKANLTQARFDAIKVGMTLDQVNTTMGCQYAPLQLTWGDRNINAGNPPGYDIWQWQAIDTISYIQVYFDSEGKKVVVPGTNPDGYKMGLFLQP
jgi:hypothetical protein